MLNLINLLILITLLTILSWSCFPKLQAYFNQIYLDQTHFVNKHTLYNHGVIIMYIHFAYNNNLLYATNTFVVLTLTAVSGR